HSLVFHCSLHHRAPHSFPTRRSSDLDFLAAIAHRVVNLPETAAADAALQGVPVQRPLSRIVDELHRSTRQHPESYLLTNSVPTGDRKSTRLNSSHVSISYAVFCLKKK